MHETSLGYLNEGAVSLIVTSSPYANFFPVLIYEHLLDFKKL